MVSRAIFFQGSDDDGEHDETAQLVKQELKNKSNLPPPPTTND